MKLGICYMVFDGSELLEFAVKSIRNAIDFISVTYQTTSYFGNPVDDFTIQLLNDLKTQGLIDNLIHFEPDLTIHPKYNELRLRNIGLEASRNANCTHHISADVDEFYEADKLINIKESVFDVDFCMAPYFVYYKKPTWLVQPTPKYKITFIHSVNNEYEINKDFPFQIEITRRLKIYNTYKVLTLEEMPIHHMSYVRKDIRRKLLNSDNGRAYNIDKFVVDFNKYELGERFKIAPDFMNRTTKEVPNIFNIKGIQ